MKDLTQRIKEINSTGWYVLNMFQLPAAKLWRVNLQYFTSKGASTDYFTVFADAADLGEALEAAFFNTKSVPTGKASAKAKPLVIAKPAKADTKKQDQRIASAMDKLWMTLKQTNGART